MTGALLVALGAAVGAPLRYLADRAMQRRRPGPWGTLLVNVVGSFVLGAVAARAGAVQVLVGTGFCGALTTYSTFAYETVQLAARGDGRRAAVDVLASTALGVAAAALGSLLA